MVEGLKVSGWRWEAKGKAEAEVEVKARGEMVLQCCGCAVLQLNPKGVKSPFDAYSISFRHLGLLALVDFRIFPHSGPYKKSTDWSAVILRCFEYPIS